MNSAAPSGFLFSRLGTGMVLAICSVKSFSTFFPQFPVSNVVSLYFTSAWPAFKIKLAIILAFVVLYSIVVRLMVSDVPERTNVVLCCVAVCV